MTKEGDWDESDSDIITNDKLDKTYPDRGPFVQESGGRKYVVHMSPHNPNAVMMRLPYNQRLHSNVPPPPLPREPIVDYGPTLGERFAGLFRGPIENALDKDLEEAGVKRRGFFRDPMDDAVDEMERRLKTLANEKDPDRAIAEQERREEIINPARIKARAENLPDAKPHEIMQWGWDAEKLFARRQDELHDAYIKGGVKAKSQTNSVTNRIKKITGTNKTGLLRKLWLKAVKYCYDDPISAALKNNRGDYFSILPPKERFAKTLDFISQLERAVEEDITIAQEQIGFCSEASLEMDQYYRALKTYDRELKRQREPIIDKARQQAVERFDDDDAAMRQMHEREVLDTGSHIDERLGFLDMALSKCQGEYGVYVSAMEHEKLAIDALQKLLRERLPKLEREVKRAIRITEDQEAMKAKGAGRGIDADIEHKLTPEQAEIELKAIAAQVTLQIDVIEKLHAAIIHDERLVIEGKEPEALLEARETLLLEDKRPLALPAPSKPVV